MLACFAAFLPPEPVCVWTVGPPFGRIFVFSLEVSQKSSNEVGLRAKIVFGSRSHAAWESFFSKVALKALAEAEFFFGGESSFFREISNIFMLLSIFVLLARVLQRYSQLYVLAEFCR